MMNQQEMIDVFRKVDERLSSIPKICGKGCSFCCYQPIKCTDPEWEMIQDFIEKMTDAVLIQRIVRNAVSWFDCFDRIVPKNITVDQFQLEAYEKKMQEHRIACPFLIDGICSIYSVRPFVCRGHSVRESVDLCSQNPLRMGDGESRSIALAALKEIHHRIGVVLYGRLSIRLLRLLKIEIGRKILVGAGFLKR